MTFVIGYGEWLLAKPKLIWRSNPPFTSLHVNFDSKSGTAREGTGMGRQPKTSPLQNLTILSDTRFRANYTFGTDSGTLDATIDDNRVLDVSFAGTVTTSCNAHPIRTRPPRELAEALRLLTTEGGNFANQTISDWRTRDEYNAAMQKYRRSILSDVRDKQISKAEAVREVHALRHALAGLGLAESLLPRLQSAANAGATVAAHRWGQHGTMTALEAFGAPRIPDHAWVHFAPSDVADSIRQGGVTTTTKSSWARWGEIKNLTYGHLVFRIGSMSLSAESDLALLAIAAEGSPVREVKGLYGFKVEGEASTTVRVRVIESTYLRSLEAAQRAMGKTLAELEEIFCAKRFGDQLKSRAAATPGVRLFDRLTPSEQARVRLDIVETVAPSTSRPLPAKAGKAAKIGRCLLVVSIGISMYRIVVARDKLKQASREVIGFAGGAAAGLAAGKTGSALMPQASPLIIAAGVLIGGFLGALGADFAFEWADSLTARNLEENF